MQWLNAFLDDMTARADAAQIAREEDIRQRGIRAGRELGYRQGHEQGRHDGAADLVKTIAEPRLRQHILYMSEELSRGYRHEIQLQVSRFVSQIADKVPVHVRVPSFDPSFPAVDLKATTVRLSFESFHLQLAICS